ncbi:unnamed protein product [Amoebophrya sp. A25]|nr:unnamed protein product [Amoebophrya sp. A25]|eukprot:GSA25T00008014001.1
MFGTTQGESEGVKIHGRLLDAWRIQTSTDVQFVSFQELSLCV